MCTKLLVATSARQQIHKLEPHRCGATNELKTQMKSREELMKFKARVDGVVLSSHECKLLGGFYGAAGETPRPTAILLHGVPGVEKNLDFAYALRDAGWNALYFHYRGCWGSEGAYSLDGLLYDVQAATEWALDQASVDKENLVLMGSSMGGYATLAAGAADSRFKALAALCPLIDPTTAPLSTETATEFAGMLQGVTATELKAQWERLPSIVSMADRLRNRKILLATGDQDDFFHPDHYVQFLKEVPNAEWRRFPVGDHSFSACRKELVETLLKWLGGARD
jgi:dipeptidyl aminopeptidase/acylaminoacyl peptidase